MGIIGGGSKLKINQEEVEFLTESNKIEREYSNEALEDAKHAWNFAKKHKHNPIDINYIQDVHLELMRELNPRIAGNIREVDVWVGNKKCLNPKKIKEELRLLCNPGLYPISSENFIKEWHIQFEKVHPFEDGNGRVGRILMNIQRLNINLPILIIHEGEEQLEYYSWWRKL